MNNMDEQKAGVKLFQQFNVISLTYFSIFVFQKCEDQIL